LNSVNFIGGTFRPRQFVFSILAIIASVSVFAPQTFPQPLDQTTELGNSEAAPIFVRDDDEIYEHRLSYHWDLHAPRPANEDFDHPTVTLGVLIAPSGDVLTAEVLEGEQEWHEQAVRAALSWKYRPFEHDARAVYAVIRESISILPPEVRTEKPVPFPEIKNWNSLRITLRRNGPYYSVEIRGDGTVIYQGGESAPVGGRHEARISPQTVRELYDAFRAADYFSTLDEYKIVGFHLAVNRTSIEFDGIRKSVLNVVGSELGIPASVAELENAIDHAAGTRKWTRITSETLPSLIEEGYFKRRERNTSLLATMIAAKATPDLVRQLIDLGAPVNGMDPHAFRLLPGTPLMVAAKRADREIVQMLLAAGAGKNDRAQMSWGLLAAAEGGSTELVKTFLQLGGNPDHRDRPAAGGMTPLMFAAVSGNTDTVTAILAAGGSVNAKARDGTPVLVFAGYGIERDERGADAEQTTRLLLDAGADPRDRMNNDESRTVYDEFCRRPDDRKCAILKRWMSEHPRPTGR
jgi:hypothetical protein